SAPKPSESEASSCIFPERWINLANDGSFAATRRVPFAICWGVAFKALGKLAHEPGEVLSRKPQVVLAQILERPDRDMLGAREVLLGRGDVRQPGDGVPSGPASLDPTDPRPPVGRVVILVELLEHDVRAVVQTHVAHGAGLVVDVHLLEERDEGHI